MDVCVGELESQKRQNAHLPWQDVIRKNLTLKMQTKVKMKITRLYRSDQLRRLQAVTSGSEKYELEGNNSNSRASPAEGLDFFNYQHEHGFFKNIFIDYAITVVPFPRPTPLHPAHPLPPKFPPYNSCPWVILIISLASTFPTLFLPSPCLFSTYHLCYLFSVPFPPLSPSRSPIDNPPCHLHFCGSVPVLVVCLVCFCFCFRCGC